MPSIDQLLESGHKPEEVEERNDVTRGPAVPEEEIREPDSENHLLRTSLKTGGVITALGAAGYTLTELTPEYSVEDFLELVPEEQAINYGNELLSYGVEHGPEIARYTQELIS